MKLELNLGQTKTVLKVQLVLENTKIRGGDIEGTIDKAKEYGGATTVTK